MSIELHQYAPGVMLVTYSGQITPEEHLKAICDFLDHLQTVSCTVHLIADWRSAHNYPISYDLIPSVMSMLRHKYMGWVVVVGMNSVLSFWADLFVKLGNLHYTACPSVEQAVDFICHLEPTAQAVR